MPADSRKALLRWLESQRSVAAETMQVRVLTALAGKILDSAPDSSEVLLKRARTFWQALAEQSKLNRIASFALLEVDILLRAGRSPVSKKEGLW